MHFEWPYYELINGRLCLRTKRGVAKVAFPSAPMFADAAQAEAWLEANDLRGNVR
jgi:hypothetical protein